MDSATELLVRHRAQQRCEYCTIGDELDVLPFHVDHIIARQHRGSDHLSNLAWACYSCNLHKGPNLTGIDRRSRKITRLFHPRRHQWSYHFRWNSPILEGRTAIGRVTIEVLAINAPHRVQLRSLLLELSQFHTDA